MAICFRFLMNSNLNNRIRQTNWLQLDLVGWLETLNLETEEGTTIHVLTGSGFRGFQEAACGFARGGAPDNDEIRDNVGG